MKCSEIEDLEEKHYTINLHKKVREYKKRHTGIIKDKNGNILLNPQERIKIWKEYIQDLFIDERGERNS